MNDTPRPRLFSEHRLQRLSLWLALSVAWFAAHVLARLAPCAAGRVLNEHARHARLLLTLRAVKITAFRHRLMHADMRRLTCRAVAGGALRRKLGAGSLSQRAAALCTALANPERWVALIAKRLQRRFTKLRRLPAPQRTRAHPTAAPLRVTRAINSS